MTSLINGETLTSATVAPRVLIALAALSEDAPPSRLWSFIHHGSRRLLHCSLDLEKTSRCRHIRGASWKIPDLRDYMTGRCASKRRTRWEGASFLLQGTWGSGLALIIYWIYSISSNNLNVDLPVRFWGLDSEIAAVLSGSHYKYCFLFTLCWLALLCKDSV